MTHSVASLTGTFTVSVTLGSFLGKPSQMEFSTKEAEKSNDEEPSIENKTEVSSSKTDKLNNKTDSNSTTDSKKELKMTFEFLSKHIHECVKKEMKKNCKWKHKKYISSSSESSDTSDTSSSDSDDDSNSSKLDSESKYRQCKKHRKSKHSKSNPKKR